MSARVAVSRVLDGPKEASNRYSECCGRSPHCGHSLQVQDLEPLDLTDRAQSAISVQVRKSDRDGAGVGTRGGKQKFAACAR